MGTSSTIKDNDKTYVFFDGVCNLCNGAVNHIIDHDRQDRFRMASLQSEKAESYLQPYGEDPNDLNSIIVLKNDTVYKKSKAVIEIAKDLYGQKHWKVKLMQIFPNRLRNIIYDLVAKSRYQVFGKRETCRMPSEEVQNKFL